MTDKDQKDMTASKLLRWLADDDDRSNCQACSRFYASDECGGKMCSDWKRDLADKIDAEIVKAYSEKLDTCAMRWAKANGWPDFKDGEDFGTWLDRCAIPRPRFESGEPVQFGEETDVGTVAGFVFNAPSRPRCCAYEVVTEENGAVSIPDGDVLKRPAPEVLGADGKPIVVGETVYRLSDGTAWKVTKLHHSEHRISVVSVGGKGVTAGGWFLASEYTHTPPDNQQKIDDDATMPPAEYCAVRGIDLGDDPDRETATEAMVRDLLRRQRELDKRTGGE